MANILEKYGIKEVADVTFYDISTMAPVLYLDTLKVSTIEQTAEEVNAQGGKGNATYIIWDYGRDITITLEDALFSAKSMAMMFGNGTIDTNTTQLKKTISWTGRSTVPTDFEGPQGKKYNVPTEAITYDAFGNIKSSDFSNSETYFTTFDMNITDVGVIEISANAFPGTYYVTGDTYARSEINGKDEMFQFIIPKAKIQSENTIALEADGDPSVFNLNLRVLYNHGDMMMKLVKYKIADIEEAPHLEFFDLLPDTTTSSLLEGQDNDYEDYDDVTFNDLIDNDFPVTDNPPLVSEE